jgi:hypothetical protein
VQGVVQGVQGVRPYFCPISTSCRCQLPGNSRRFAGQALLFWFLDIIGGLPRKARQKLPRSDDGNVRKSLATSGTRRKAP